MSVYRVVLPLRYTICGDMFPNVDRIPNIESPIFIIHGTRDEIVPFEHGQVKRDDDFLDSTARLG